MAIDCPVLRSTRSISLWWRECIARGFSLICRNNGCCARLTYLFGIFLCGHTINVFSSLRLISFPETLSVNVRSTWIPSSCRSGFDSKGFTLTYLMRCPVIIGDWLSAGLSHHRAGRAICRCLGAKSFQAISFRLPQGRIRR